MSTATTAVEELAVEERKAQARDAYRRSISEGAPLSGKALGTTFGLSERSGRRLIAEARAEADPPGRSSGQPDGDGQTGPLPNGHGHGDDAARPAGHHGGQWPRPGSHPLGDEPANDPQTSAVGRVNDPGSAVPFRRDGDVAGQGAVVGAAERLGRSPSGNGQAVTGSAQPNGHEHAWSGRDGHSGQGSGQPAGVAMAAGRPERAGEVPWWVRTVTVLAVLAVALAAAVASFEHLHAVAVMAGEGGRAWLLPVSVDGLVITATMVLYAVSKTRRPAGGIAWLALGLGLTASLAGNVIATSPDLVSPDVLRIIVAAWPPVALALALHILLHQTDTD